MSYGPQRSHELLTQQEACALLRCARSTLYKLRRDGDLPTYYVGRSVRLRRQDLAHYLERTQREALGRLA